MTDHSIERLSSERPVDEPANALSIENLARVRYSLTGAGAVAFGWHHQLDDNISPTLVLASSERDYLDLVQPAAAGDHFTLYDLDSVITLAVARLDTPTTVSALEEAVGGLRVDRQVILVLRNGGFAHMSELSEADGWDDDLGLFLAQPGGEVFLFDTTPGSSRNRLDADAE
ncbi:MAG TPA: hypothetical protein VGP46_03975, partial [Acidimicrobiales bacterium]|nr:hypothetical protein [Acidimicrobiales bacterium]